jgi:hypothetical protein
MAYKIPLSNKTGINFDYYGVNRFSALRWNTFMQCWVCDYSFDEDITVNSLALRAGINILQQFGIPFNIYIVNNSFSDLDPGNFGSLSAFIFTREDAQNLITYKNPNPGG